MADCELLAGCLFFNDKMAGMPTTAELMKDSYCHDNSSECARHMVLQELGRSKVPSDLYPNDIERARLIISSR